MITKPEEHNINRSGKRLLRTVLEPLGWVINDVQEDYGIDSYVQVFDGKSPTGAWFHVQLKSSAASDYSADHTFISQELSIDHARHYAVEMREPVFLIHADVTSNSVYWHAPQLDSALATAVSNANAKSITVRISTAQQLSRTAPDFLTSLDQIYLVLGTKEFASASTQSFAESLQHLTNQEELYRACQEKGDLLKLHKIRDLYRQRNLERARPLAEAVLLDPDSTIETKFWARIQLEGIDFAETVHAGKPQSELPQLHLTHAKALQKLTASGPKPLKFYSLIARHAAELEILVHENSSLFMALHQHLRDYGDPMMALGLFARRSALTRQIVSKYNRCVLLARYAANYPNRWVLGRALTNIVRAIARYLITLRSEKKFAAEKTFAQSALQICKLAAWISEETADPEGIILALISALLTTDSEESDAYRWATEVAHKLAPEARKDALVTIERVTKRWKGETVEGDYRGDTIWQIIQNMATGLGIDISDENVPLVRGLRIAARDNSPERVLTQCEHLLVSQGATGPIARQIWQLFNITTASSKVVHCTLHNFHVEGKELDSAYAEFKRKHCDSCPDQKPRPEGWRYTDEIREVIQRRHYDFVARLAGTAHGLRYTKED